MRRVLGVSLFLVALCGMWLLSSFRSQAQVKSIQSTVQAQMTQVSGPTPAPTSASRQ
jgi:hypothetical protein